MNTPHTTPDYADIAENGERVCGETNSTLGLTCDRRPHAPGTAHYQIDGDAVMELVELLRTVRALAEGPQGEGDFGAVSARDLLDALGDPHPAESLVELTPADAHPWQEYNAHGNTCHYPGCRLTEDEHEESA